MEGTSGNSDYIEGLKEGSREYKMEIYQQRMKDHADKKRKEQEKDPDRGR
ncbi:hypothetical protein QQ054_36415 [Oscillatoria amoena NRMC-F 0135]|nr:hypothetical protein [Oscillatoria amoena NRMC-F 0135]